MDNPINNGFALDERLGYFRREGVDIMAFDDIYPEGHQSGISLIMNGHRLATNGDLRFEPTPGQWQCVPKQLSRQVDPGSGAITTRLKYPDPDRHAAGFNPMIYPDAEIAYTVEAKAVGAAVEVTVSLDQPLPDALDGVVSFNLELFPGALFDRPWIMDGQSGIFPRQPNGPVMKRRSVLDQVGIMPVPEEKRANIEHLLGRNEYTPLAADDLIAAPYAEGHAFTVCPDDDARSFTVESLTGALRLFDGRMNHNNGWFVLSEALSAGAAERCLKWVIRPRVIPGWRSPAVVQISQVGYHPAQKKVAVIELDDRDGLPRDAQLWRISADGPAPAMTAPVTEWGRFLRYRYAQFDFSAVRDEGLYYITCAGAKSDLFRIARDIYDRGVWQPVLEYFLPVQMCHMRVMEKYRVWHGRCHKDDARMAPIRWNHFDGYRQGPTTMTGYASGEPVPGLDRGGWHDAGDFDLRVESQAGECYNLALAYECFGAYCDTTTVDQTRQIVEIHQPDGKNDLLEQIEHGLLSVVGGYKALGRLYRGIICNRLRQYVLLGDSAAMTDGVTGDDDRWVFTEDNPQRALTTAAELAAASRAMRGFNDALADDALDVATRLYRETPRTDEAIPARLHAAAELFLATRHCAFKNDFLAGQSYILGEGLKRMAWVACRVVHELGDEGFENALSKALTPLQADLDAQCRETPYGVPYKPYIWGAGWGIQRFAFEYYFLHRAFPDLFDEGLLHRALHFVLGCHPGSNTASFASGVGTRSATVAYGLNRADWSYIPGGVVSGTALIRPDLPELLTFPYLWQQTEYVLGGGSSQYMFLVLAVQSLLAARP